MPLEPLHLDAGDSLALPSPLENLPRMLPPSRLPSFLLEPTASSPAKKDKQKLPSGVHGTFLLMPSLHLLVTDGADAEAGKSLKDTRAHPGRLTSSGEAGRAPGLPSLLGVT